MLQLDDEPDALPLDEQWRAGRWLRDLCNALRGCLGLAPLARGARRGGKERWLRLWERRRRGLVKQRIVSEHEDQTARILELEEHVTMLEYELACARGVHPCAISGVSDDCQASVGSSVGSLSVDHSAAALEATSDAGRFGPRVPSATRL